jgi:hypothetical protein
VATIFSQGRFNMRKVLLATTALVALGGVSVAHADLSISGSYEFDYVDTDGTVAVANDGNLKVTGTSAADNGINWTVVGNYKFGDLTAEDGAEDAYIQAAGDFGTVIMGKSDNAAERLDGSLGKNVDIHSSGAKASTSQVASTLTDSITYISPNVSGVTFGYTMEPETSGDSSYIVTYSGNGISAHYAANDTASQMGVSFSMNGATIAIGAGDDGSASDAKSKDFGVKYALNDTTTVAAMTASADNGEKYSNVGAKITLGGGAYTMVEYASAKDTDGVTSNVSTIIVGMSF